MGVTAAQNLGRQTEVWSGTILGVRNKLTYPKTTPINVARWQSMHQIFTAEEHVAKVWKNRLLSTSSVIDV